MSGTNPWPSWEAGIIRLLSAVLIGNHWFRILLLREDEMTL